MPALAASLATNPHASRSPLRASTLAGQACGWVGDIALLRSGTAAFAAGAGAFGCGHLAYLTGLWRSRDRAAGPADTQTARAAVGAFAIAGPVMAAGAYRQDRRLGPAVLAYSALLCALWACAGNLDPGLTKGSRRLLLAGAVTFNLSDAVLGTTRFCWPKAPDRLESVVMGTYAAAQLLLSLGAVHAAPVVEADSGGS